MIKEDDKYSAGARRITIIVVVITAFITTFTGSALNLSIPDIGEEFSVSAGFVGWLITGYTLSVAAFSVPFGRLADITCRKTVLVAGIGIFVICCILSVFSASMVMLMTVRIIQGMGASMIFSTNTAVLISAFPGNMRGKVIGYSIASTYVGLSAGPVVGGFLNHAFGWRAIFIVTGILGIVSFAAAFWKLPKDSGAQEASAENGKADEEERKRQGRPEAKEKAAAQTGKSRAFDLGGNILYVLFIVLLMYGLSEINRGLISVLCAAAGTAFGVLFIYHELKTETPVVNIRLFRKNAGYAFSNLSALLNYGATFAISYLISIYLQVVMDYSSRAAGLIMISQPAIMAVLTPITGRFSDRFSPFKMSSAGMAFCAVGTFIFIFAGRDTSLFVIIAALAVTGFGFSLFSSPNTNAVMSCVEKADYGVASSILATMRSIGHTLSMVIVTVIVTVNMPDIPLAEASPDVLVNVIRVSFIIFTVICAAGVFVSLKRK